MMLLKRRRIQTWYYGLICFNFRGKIRVTMSLKCIPDMPVLPKVTKHFVHQQSGEKHKDMLQVN